MPIVCHKTGGGIKMTSKISSAYLYYNNNLWTAFQQYVFKCIFWKYTILQGFIPHMPKH